MHVRHITQPPQNELKPEWGKKKHENKTELDKQQGACVWSVGWLNEMVVGWSWLTALVNEVLKYPTKCEEGFIKNVNKNQILFWQITVLSA